jgi:N-acetylmuramoyl-L-alanine amidase-like
MKIWNLLLFVLSFSSISFPQAIFSEEDVKVCNTKFEFASSENLYKKPINEVIIEIGKTFLGLEYEAHTIEKGEKEQLVIHLTGLDCYTFFESSLVLTKCIKKGKTSFEDFQKELVNIRYRDGKISGYPSRLHYASDWLYDNDIRGNVKDVTKDIGGILFEKKIDFMSTHPQSYARLKNNSAFVNQIANIEKDITDRAKYYVPENFIDCVENKINNGDIILITASADGLDISHTGMAVKMDDGRIHFMHAPLRGKVIQITEKPIGDYIRGLKRHTGIMVARPLEP